MGRMFSLPFTATVTNAGGNADLWEIVPADDKPIRLWAIILGQTSEIKDAEEESIRISVIRMTATVTSSNGTTGTAEDVSRSGQTPGFTWEYNGATVATTTGDTEILAELGWNVRSTPFDLWFPEEKFCPQAVQGESMFVRLQSTLLDDITFAGTLLVEELP